MLFFKFLGILVLIFIFVCVILCVTVLSRFWSLIKVLFGISSDTKARNQRQSSSNPTVSGKVKPRNSKIDKNEGEYVDFEEID